jgi:hypothetical protein
MTRRTPPGPVTGAGARDRPLAPTGMPADSRSAARAQPVARPPVLRVAPVSGEPGGLETGRRPPSAPVNAAPRIGCQTSERHGGIVTVAKEFYVPGE